MNGQGKLLTHFLKNADKLVIPVYQRNYDWKEEHCKKLYSDLVKTVREGKRWHFFGGIVSVSDPMGSSSDYLVIDGQQRITTVSLLLLAIANLVKAGIVTPKDPNLYDVITKKYLVDEINPKQRKMKLKPIKGDQDSYDRLWGDPSEYNQSSRITQNYLYFYNQIQRDDISVDQLFSAVEKLQIIDITLTPPDDDPQLVFESLNSTGLDLNEGDKIRNFVLMRRSMEEQEQFYDDYWSPIEKNAGYDKQTNSYDVSPFIRDYLGIKERRLTAMKEIYQEFKDYVEKRGQIEDVLKELLDYAKRYNEIRSGSPEFPLRLRASLYRLNRFESSVCRPFLMEVFRLQEEDLFSLDTVAEVCRIVEAYLLRRLICDLPSNTQSKVFLTLCNDIKRLDGTYDSFLEKMKYVLGSKKEKAAFPTDEDFAEGLKTKNIYTMPTRYKAYIFERLENGDSSEYKEIYNRLDSGEYTIEHIMPQKLTPAWAAELGDDAESIHDQWLHRLANLTLAASAYNIRYSNSSFQEKKTMKDGYLQSGLKMTQQIAKADHWGLTELEERYSSLIQQCICLWPYADTTYTPPQKQYDEIALDDDATFTGRQLVKYRFRGNEHETTTWVDMYVAVLKELHNVDTAYLNYLADADDSVDLASQFSRSENGADASAMVADGIYVNTGTSTQHKINMLRHLFEHYGQDPSDLVFFLNEKRDDDEESSQRHKIRRAYWTQVLPSLLEVTGSFKYVSPTKNNYLSGSTNSPGVQLSCVANYNQARVEIYIDTGDGAKNQQIYDNLKKHQAEIEETYGRPLMWYNQEGTRSCKVYDELPDVSVTNRDDWIKMMKFHSERGAMLLRAVTPYLP